MKKPIVYGQLTQKMGNNTLTLHYDPRVDMLKT
uniref:Uncharacterized protein n=1 Tax=Arundo donax TaxID=35708 RepID=A0A0A9G1K2_ARUDO